MRNLLLFTFYFIFFSSSSQAPQTKILAIGDYYQGGKIGSFTDAFYWSSCESDATYAWGQDFYDGTQGRVSKDSAGHVNAVRAF